jgi:hypothetical protein
MFQCDSPWLEGCEGQTEADNADDWLSRPGWTDGVNGLRGHLPVLRRPVGA